MTTNITYQVMAWAITHNLNWLIGFHNYVRRLLKMQFQELKKCDNENIENELHKSALYDYDRILNINTFLMMYSYLEESLYHCWKILTPNIPLVEREGSLGRFKNVIKHFDVDLSSKFWQELKNAEEIRNCLLHANGHINLLKDQKKIESIKNIVKKNKLGLEIKKDRIQISGEYLQNFNENISSFMDIMINKHNNIS